MPLTHLLALLTVLTLTITGVAAAEAHGEHQAPRGAASLDQANALKISQSAIGRTVGDYRLSDPQGKTVSLREFRGRPLVLSLIYTSCYHTCPTLTNHLAQVVEIAQDALGQDSFSVLTIGFDAANDTPERMRIFARERAIDLPNWRFLSTDQETISGLTQDLGFLYYASPKGFDHLAQTTVLDANGQVYRQVYGEDFAPPSLIEPLKQLVFGTRASATSLSGWVNSIRLFCTLYDPSTGRYHFDYSIFISIGISLLSLGAVAVFLVRAWRQSRPRRSTA